MTKHEKELQRSRMMWISLWGIIVVMLIVLVLTLLGKNVKSLEVIISAYFTTLAGVIGTSFFSKPTPGSDDIYKKYDTNYYNSSYPGNTYSTNNYSRDTYSSSPQSDYSKRQYEKLDLD